MWRRVFPWPHGNKYDDGRERGYQCDQPDDSHLERQQVDSLLRLAQRAGYEDEPRLRALVSDEDGGVPDPLPRLPSEAVLSCPSGVRKDARRKLWGLSIEQPSRCDRPARGVVDDHERAQACRDVHRLLREKSLRNGTVGKGSGKVLGHGDLGVVGGKSDILLDRNVDQAAHQGDSDGERNPMYQYSTDINTGSHYAGSEYELIRARTLVDATRAPGGESV
jgi:hypothetical protein